MDDEIRNNEQNNEKEENDVDIGSQSTPDDVVSAGGADTTEGSQSGYYSDRRFDERQNYESAGNYDNNRAGYSNNSTGSTGSYDTANQNGYTDGANSNGYNGYSGDSGYTGNVQNNGYAGYNGSYGSYNGYGDGSGENDSRNNNYGGGYNNGYGNGYGGNNYGNSQQNYDKPPYNNDNSSEDGNNKKKKNKGVKIFIIIIAAIVVVAAIAIGVIFSSSDDGSDSTGSSYENETDESSGEENVGSISVSDSTVEAGEAAEVAQIAQEYNVGILIYSNDSLYTEGSGVIAKEDDTGTYTYVITCAHVINYSDVDVSVLMSDGTEYSAEVVGLDTRTDIGVVRIEASGFTCAEFADSDDLIVGQTVYAVGNPGGSEFFGSVTNGIISAIDRPISSSTGYEMECIQHTAAINPGNSGGALVNGEGKVIGINSMKIASTEYEGMGFSVPSNVVIDVFNSIIENGYVAGRAKLGISYASPSNYSQTYAMYVQMKGLPSGTIVIAEISDDSAFADTDVEEGDMIIAVNGEDMTDTGMLSDMIEDMSVGDEITLTIVRLNTDTWTQTEFDVTVTLVEDKGTTSTSSETTTSSSSSDSGSSYEDWYEYFKQYYGY